MQTIREGYDSVSLLVRLNGDRVLYALTLLFALFFGAYLGALLH